MIGLIVFKNHVELAITGRTLQGWHRPVDNTDHIVTISHMALPFSGKWMNLNLKTASTGGCCCRSCACLIRFNVTQESRCCFVLLLMTIYWMLQPIPLAVTALIPIVLFPLLGLATTEKACEPYLQSTNMLFMASLIVAIAMESSGFHKRIALRALIFLGDNIRTLFAGFMFTTMFLGIWIINTAATAMILPIADIVTQELFDTTEVADCAEQQYSQEQVELLTPKLICKYTSYGND